MTSIPQQRAQLRAEAKRRQTETIPRLKAELKRTRGRQQQRLKAARARCKREASKTQQEIADARAKLRGWSQATREKARNACRLLKANIREEALEEIDAALQAIEAQRSQIEALRKRAAGMRDPRGQPGGRRSAERRAEREHELRSELDGDPILLAAFERVKNKLRASEHLTLREAFYEYVHSHPEVLREASAVLEARWAAEAEQLLGRLAEVPEDDGRLADYLADVDAADRHLTRWSPQGSAEAVPF